MKGPNQELNKIAAKMFLSADRPKFFAFCEEMGDTRQRSLGVALPASARRGAPSDRSTMALSSPNGGGATEVDKMVAKMGVLLSPADRERLRAELGRGSR